MVEYYREMPVYSVSELSRVLDGELERSFNDIWVEGEAGSFSKSPSGHMYFRLKDKEAVLKVAIFKQHAMRIIFQIENGMVLLVRGKLGYYGKSGDLQLYASYAEPYGAGALQMALEQAKKRLQSDGLTDPARKRRIPPFPGKIGIVTSPEGAAIKDIISILKRRGAPFEIIVSPSPVQGEQAPAELKKAMERLLKIKGIEIILLTRGGGSFEDLNAFNDESLARFVAASPVPVVSAVGHEIDVVLTDLTADLRAPTPSAAAEILSQPSVSVRERLSNLINISCSTVSNRIALAGERLSLFNAGREGRSLSRELERIEERRDRALLRFTEKEIMRLDAIAARMAFLKYSLHPQKLVSSFSVLIERISSVEKGLIFGIGSIVSFREGALRNAIGMLEVKNPLSVLSKGYSILKDREQKAVRTASQVEVGEQLSLLLYKGNLKITVDDKE
jgi:exodeoxyribonuclease VII large subunit